MMKVLPLQILTPAVIGLLGIASNSGQIAVSAGDPFTIQVVDQADGRGVPLVQLETTDQTRYYTDSSGIVAFDEPGLMGQDVWFGISSHGYEFPQESMGRRGITLKAVPGDEVQIEIRRLNLAQRLYRVTGQGIYRDTVMVGRDPPIAQPLLNGKVMGQDSCQTTIYRDKIYWFWGDTNRPDHFLGNFAMAGATSQLPDRGGLSPAVGVDLEYFVDPETQFARPMAVTAQTGSRPLWLDAILTVLDDAGQERMFAHYQRVQGFEPTERGFMVFDDANQRFETLAEIPLEPAVAPGGSPFRVAVDGQPYFYFPIPYPAVRVKADWASVRDISAYEGFSCLKDGSHYDPSGAAIDRDADGNPIWRWRKDTAVLKPGELQELVDRGLLERMEIPFRLECVDQGKPVRLHRSSVCWNEYRNAWVMIGVEQFGESLLGEVWFAEAHAPEGPWNAAKKIATHAMQDNDQDFYNPLQHPYFAEDGGRVIYFEGTYVNTFSGNPFPTPRYNYNQLMYRLDLSDPRLEMTQPEMPDAPPEP